MSRVVLLASVGAVLEMAACVGLRAATDFKTISTPSVAVASYATPPQPAPVVVVSSPRQAAAAPPEHSPLQREWDRLASVDGAQCRQKLAELGMRFSSLPDQVAPDTRGCGIPHGVLVQQGPTGITYAPPLQIDCSLALELPAIEHAIQDQAEAHLGSSIRTVTTFGTFSCRNIRGSSGKLSEHALGNAIDVGAFTPRKGRTVTVARDYRPGKDAPNEESLFLRAVFHALRRDGGLTYVIGPETRADHQDHFHLDRAEPWWHPWRSGV